MTKGDDDAFFVRWARRKEATRRGHDVPDVPGVPGDESPASSAGVEPDSVSPADETAETKLLESLPDIDSLTLESDFTPFLQRSVPEALKRRALRKLWRLDPVFANLDGLNNYDEDYTKVGKVVLPELRSIYRVGRGMILGEDPANEAPVSKAAESQTPVAETAGSGSQAAESPQNPAADPKTSAATLPAPEVAARAEASAQPDKPSATAALPRDEDEAVRGGTDPAGTRRRHAVARRWGESSR